jgi:hypothetical protein
MSEQIVQKYNNVGIGTDDPTTAKLVIDNGLNAAIDVSGGRIIGLPSLPSDPAEAASKAYADSIAGEASGTQIVAHCESSDMSISVSLDTITGLADFKTTIGGTLLSSRTPVYAGWTEVRPDGDTDHSWSCLASSDDGTMILAGNDSSLWLSTDSGATWAEANTPVVGIPKSFVDVKVSGDGTVMLAHEGTDFKLYISIDSGVTWAETRPGSYTSGNMAIAIDRTGAHILVTNRYETSTAFLSVNKGTTWTPVTTGVFQPKFAAMSRNGACMLVAGVAHTARISYNYGATWSTSATFSAEPLSFSINEDGSAIVVGVTSDDPVNSGVSISTDHGNSWQHIWAASAIQTDWIVSISNNGATIFAGDTDTSNQHVSTDSGATWTTAIPLDQRVGAVFCCGDIQTLLLGLATRLFKKSVASYIETDTVQLDSGLAVGYEIPKAAPPNGIQVKGQIISDYISDRAISIDPITYTSMSGAISSLTNQDAASLSILNSINADLSSICVIIDRLEQAVKLAGSAK